MSSSETASGIAPVVKSLTVELAPDEAFRLFTSGIGRWWPLVTHSVYGADAATCAIEERVGGEVYELHRDGRRSVWGRVTAWEAPRLFACSWHAGRGPESAQQLEVAFAPEGAGTRVTLTHTGWELLGERGEEMRENYVSGWDMVLGAYTALAAAPGQAA
jgi:hypothetical protein